MGKSLKNKNIALRTDFTARMAQDYFLTPNGDFKMVCTLAGFDHESKDQAISKGVPSEIDTKVCPCHLARNLSSHTDNID